MSPNVLTKDRVESTIHEVYDGNWSEVKQIKDPVYILILILKKKPYQYCLYGEPCQILMLWGDNQPNLPPPRC